MHSLSKEGGRVRERVGGKEALKPNTLLWIDVYVSQNNNIIKNGNFGWKINKIAHKGCFL